MPYVTPAMIEKAKEMDLFTYLQNYEPAELMLFSGNTYTTKTHDSLKISNGKWMWWSRGIGGKTALDYLIKVKGLEFTDAVETIMGQSAISSPVRFYAPPKTKANRLQLPKRNANNDRVIKYLSLRGIDIEIINRCIQNGSVYESFPNHNAVFVGFDKVNKPRYAAYRGTGNERFIGDATGSDKYYSFRLVSSKSDTVHLFESAIDLLSYATLIKLKRGDFECENLLSLAGVYMPQKVIENSKVPKALEQYLMDSDSVKRVVFHLDNDYIGRLATKAISTVLPNEYEKISEPPPKGKDYNDYLCILLGLNKTTNLSERNVSR